MAVMVGESKQKNLLKEVYFDRYCKNCKYRDLEKGEDPCYDCLGEPLRVCSHKPVKYKGETKWTR